MKKEDIYKNDGKWMSSDCAFGVGYDEYYGRDATWLYKEINDNTVRVYLTEDTGYKYYSVPDCILCEDNVRRKVIELYVHSIMTQEQQPAEIRLPNTIEDVFIDYIKPSFVSTVKQEIKSNSLYFILPHAEDSHDACQSSKYLSCCNASLYKNDDKGMPNELIFLYQDSFSKCDNYAEPRLIETISKIRPYALRVNRMMSIVLPPSITKLETLFTCNADCKEIIIKGHVSNIEERELNSSINLLAINNLPSQIAINEEFRRLGTKIDYKGGHYIKEIRFSAPQNLHGKIKCNGMIELHKAIEPHISLSGEDVDGNTLTIDIFGRRENNSEILLLVESKPSPWKYFDGNHKTLTEITILQTNSNEPLCHYYVYESKDEVEKLLNDCHNQ